MTVAVGPLSFPTKVAVERHIRELLELHRPRSGDRAPLSPSGRAFALDLLEGHPHKGVVIGSGVAEIYCQICNHNALRFLLERTDGTFWDFSWRKCLSYPDDRKYLAGILRYEVEAQIFAFRGTVAFPFSCPITGETVTLFNCHIDHASPNTFAVLVSKWLEITGTDPATVTYSSKTKYGERTTLANRDTARHWQEFHRLHSTLRAVSQRANLSVLRKLK